MDTLRGLGARWGRRICVSFFPGYIDWRVGRGPVEREPLYRAKLRFAEYGGQNEHEHTAAFCWKEFYVQEDAGVTITANPSDTGSGLTTATPGFARTATRP